MEPLNTVLLGTTAVGSHCAPMSGFRTTSTLAHVSVDIRDGSQMLAERKD